MGRDSIHQQLTAQIIAMLEAGVASHTLPWQRGGCCATRPVNAATNRRYRGVNILCLWARSIECGFTSGLWGTYRQWSGLGAQVCKGERGTPIVFYKRVTRAGSAGEADEEYFLARASRVFAAEQVEGFALPDLAESELDPIEEVERFVANTRARIVHAGDRAFYSPAADQITMPDKARFIDGMCGSATESYYAVLLHELTHWTGHRSRCDRSDVACYAFEELVAELGAAFLCADLGITAAVREDHVDYLAGWLEALKNDDRAIFRAATLATGAADYLFALQPSSRQDRSAAVG